MDLESIVIYCTVVSYKIFSRWQILPTEYLINVFEKQITRLTE